MEQINVQQHQNQMITTQEFAAKAQSKREIYQFLCQEVRAYLPEPTLISMYFCKELIFGSKKILKQEDVKHLYVPYYENLTVKEIIHFSARNFVEVGVYFPEIKEQAKLPRQWIINILFSTIGDPFSKFVKSRTEERNSKICVKKNLNISIDPDILQAFKNSTLVSLGQNGKGASILKIGSKRKRTKREVADEAAQKALKEEQIAQKMAQYDAMQNELSSLQQQVQQHQSSTQIVEGMINQGVAQVDDQGNVTITENQSRSGSKQKN